MKELESIHLVALSIDARRKEGTPAHAKAKELSDRAVKLWKKQLWDRESKKCPHCGNKL